MINLFFRLFRKYERKRKGIQFKYISEKLRQYGYIDENTGILTVDTIRDICSEIFSQYDVSYCYLFGSYAKGKAKEDSDIDLLINSKVDGLQFFGLAEELREELKKKVDLPDQRQLIGNFELVNEILKDGIKIYG